MNQSAFLEELRKIDKDIASARFEATSTMARYISPTPEQKAEQEKYFNERQQRFYVSISEANERLSYLLSLVKSNAFDTVIDDLYSLPHPLTEKTAPTDIPYHLLHQPVACNDFFERVTKSISATITPPKAVGLVPTCPFCGDPVKELKDTILIGHTHLCLKCGSVNPRMRLSGNEEVN